MTEREFLADVLALMDSGVLQDRSEKPLRPTVTIVATQRTSDERLAVLEQFVVELQQKHPLARLVVGDTSAAEKAAVVSAQMVGMDYRIIEKADKDEWDAGSVIRDERCVAASTHVVALDESARSKEYKKFASRTGKYFAQI
jgi:hypothetical protein